MSDLADLVEALALLTPREIAAIRKIRVGHLMRDGGYVIADRLRRGQKVYSYGIATEASFELGLARRGLDIFMYDHTIAAPPYDHAHFHFRREGISAAVEPERSVFPLAHHVAANRHTDDDMILKMDVEGAEWDVLDGIEPALLGRFEQIAVETHDLDRLAEAGFRARFARVFRKLTDQFHIIHVHSNNTVPIQRVFGLHVPVLLEISLLRKDIAIASPWRGFIPSALDAPNVPGPDHVLAFFPFLPMGLSDAEFKAGLTAALRLAHGQDEQRLARIVDPIVARGANIAGDGVCSQSSLSRWSVAADEAARALRRTRTGGFAFHTDFQSEPWWMIDFHAPRHFDEILCFNRLDECSERANELVVEISDDAAFWHVVHEQHGRFGGADGDPLRVILPRTRARYVRLRIPGYAALHLDGVEIYDWSADAIVSGANPGSDHRQD